MSNARVLVVEDEIIVAMDIANTLQKLGHEVTVLTGFPNWPSGRPTDSSLVRSWVAA